MTHHMRAGTAFVLLAGLSACSGEADFKTSFVETCKAVGADFKGGDCVCVAAVLDGALNANEKTATLILIQAFKDKDYGGVAKKLSDAGVTTEDAKGMERAQVAMKDKFDACKT